MRKILILASNPNRDLALDREIRDLEGVVKRSKNRDEFEVRVGSAVRPEDLQELLLDCDPQIVHFCGHGTGEQGLVLQNSAGREQLVSTSALSSLFKLFTGKVECVLLNACYSEVQANAISQHINYVIGMSQTILDDAAIAFATGFYRGLGYGRTTDEAYHFGCNAIELMPSTTVISRSPTAPKERKLTAEFTVIPGAPIAVPEHLKPVLKKRQTLAAQSSGVNIPAVPTSETKRVEIAQDVSNALEREAWLKQYRNCVRDFLADGILTPEEKLRLGLLAKQLGLDPAEAVTIFQEEEQLRFAQVNDRSDEPPISTRRDRSIAPAKMLPLVSPEVRSRPFFQKPLFQIVMVGGLVALLGVALKWGHPASIQTQNSSIAPQQPTDSNKAPAQPEIPEKPQISEADQSHLKKIQEVLKVNDTQTAQAEANNIEDATTKQQAKDLIAQTQKGMAEYQDSQDQAHVEEVKKILLGNTTKAVQDARTESNKIATVAVKLQADGLIGEVEQAIAARAEQDSRDQAHVEEVKKILLGNTTKAVQDARTESSKIATAAVKLQADGLITEAAKTIAARAEQESASQVTPGPDERTMLPLQQCYKVDGLPELNIRANYDLYDGVVNEPLRRISRETIVISAGETVQASNPNNPDKIIDWLKVTQPIEGWVAKGELAHAECPAETPGK